MNTIDVVRAYHDARFRGDVAAAVALTGTPFRFESPMLRFDDPAGHLAGLPDFLRIVTGVELRSELYGPPKQPLSTTCTPRRRSAPSAPPSTSASPAG